MVDQRLYAADSLSADHCTDGLDNTVCLEQKGTTKNDSGCWQYHLSDSQDGRKDHAGHSGNKAYGAKKNLVHTDIIQVICKRACRRYSHGHGIDRDQTVSKKNG